MRFREEIGESLTLGFAEAAARRREAGLPILSLGLGEPDFDTPELLVRAVNEVLAEGNSRYSSPLGLGGLRERIAAKLRDDNGVPAEANGILVAAGAKQALSIVLMAMLEPGDEVIVVSPSFVSFVPQIYLAEPDAVVHVVGVDRTTHALPLDEIASLVGERTKAILINSPNNPAGFMHAPDELARLLSIADSSGAYVISDEVYEKLVFGEREHVSIGSLESAVERVVTINGFSKSHALTGWRVGYATLPAAIRSRVTKIQQHVNTNTNTFVQRALERAWDADCPHLPPYLEILRERAARVAAWLDGVPALRAPMAGAGFFAFVDAAAVGLDSNTFCGALLEERGVATTPGLAFGRDWDDHFRLSFAVDDETLDKALEEIAAFAAERTTGNKV